MKTFEVVFPSEPWRNRRFKVRGICQFDVLNPCWDNRASDIPGKHWSGLCDACPACTAAAKKHPTK